MIFDRDKLKDDAARLAQAGVYLGTSSWKYPGWRGQLYTDDRYIWRGNFSESRFERNCLAEYAEVFKSVCVDAAYYKFPDRRFLDSLFPQVPQDFLFAFKVTDAITIKNFPNMPRHGAFAGKPNPHFLDAEQFDACFLEPCRPFQKNISLLIFEFSRFSSSEFARGSEFVEALEQFLVRLPKGWPYGVEIRNRSFLHPEYFAALARHGVAHVFNSWQAMPSIGEQLDLPGSITNPDLIGARFLLKPGRKYEEAVKMFSPYSEIKDPYPEGRQAGSRLIKQTTARGGTAKAFIYINNRFEGNALATLKAIVEAA